MGLEDDPSPFRARLLLVSGEGIDMEILTTEDVFDRLGTTWSVSACPPWHSLWQCSGCWAVGLFRDVFPKAGVGKRRVSTWVGQEF